MAAMRFRIWHLLAAMVFVALWAPLSQGLLVLEAKDHPSKPQGIGDVIAFYAGTAAIVGAAMVIPWIVIRERRRRMPEPASTRPSPSGSVVPALREQRRPQC
jgi:hypothetical protein